MLNNVNNLYHLNNQDTCVMLKSDAINTSDTRVRSFKGPTININEDEEFCIPSNIGTGDTKRLRFRVIFYSTAFFIVY